LPMQLLFREIIIPILEEVENISFISFAPLTFL